MRRHKKIKSLHDFHFWNRPPSRCETGATTLLDGAFRVEDPILPQATIADPKMQSVKDRLHFWGRINDDILWSVINR